MTFDQDTKLFEVLAGGYHLNTQLQALLGRPLDSLGQQEAMAFSQEVSQVFKVSMSMLKRNTVVTRVKTAPEIRTGNSSGVIIQAAKDKRARSDTGEVVTPAKKCKEEGVIRKEITVSPHKDGYEWRKYGQKNIRDCNFVRHYFRCSRDRRCEAKKKVQQQDGISHGEGGQLLPPSPVFEVTYVNEHTCNALRANADDDAAARMASSASHRTTHRAYRVVDTARDNDVLFDGLLSSSSSFPAQENETIVSCLATVISGAAPPPPSSPPPWPPARAAPAAAETRAGASDPPAAPCDHVPPPPPMQQVTGHSASVAGDGGSGGTTTTMMIDTDFSWDPSLLFCDRQLMDNDRDMHVDDAARLADTVWPRHTSAGAWRWR